MEYGVDRLKVVLAGVLASFMLCAAAMPAVAQDGGDATSVTGDATSDTDNSVSGQYTDIDTDICSNFAQGQYVGGNLIIGEGGVNSVINQCIAAGFLPDGGDGDTPPGDQYTPPGGTDPGPTDSGNPGTSERVTEVNGEKIVISADLPKVLANTGGFAPSAASMLLPAGALLVVSGAMTFWLGTRRR